MSERNSEQLTSRSTFEEASRHLMGTLQAYGPLGLRDSVSAIVWDAREHADWMSSEVVLDTFSCKELAVASLRYGTASFLTPVNPDNLLNYSASPRFQEIQNVICDRVPEPDVRSLVFFSQGVKYAAAIRRAARLTSS
jgi:hypothetical protein